MPRKTSQMISRVFIFIWFPLGEEYYARILFPMSYKSLWSYWKERKVWRKLTKGVFWERSSLQFIFKSNNLEMNLIFTRAGMHLFLSIGKDNTGISGQKTLMCWLGNSGIYILKLLGLHYFNLVILWNGRKAKCQTSGIHEYSLRPAISAYLSSFYNLLYNQTSQNSILNKKEIENH